MYVEVKMDKKQYNNYLAILREELMPAMGCTEPIAIALAAAKAREVLGHMPEQMKATCSGNIVKNVKGVVVPNSGGQRGIRAAAVLGAELVGTNLDDKNVLAAGFGRVKPQRGYAVVGGSAEIDADVVAHT